MRRAVEIRPTGDTQHMERVRPSMTKSQFEHDCPPLYGTWLISKLGPSHKMKTSAAEVIARRDIRLKTRDVQGVPAIKLHDRRTRWHAIFASIAGIGLLTGVTILASSEDNSANATHVQAEQQSNATQEKGQRAKKGTASTTVTNYLGGITCSGETVKITMEPTDKDSPAIASTRVTGEPFREILPRTRAEQFWQDREAKLGPVADDNTFMIQTKCTGLTK